MKVKFEERSRGRKSLIQKSPDVYKKYYNETCRDLLPADNMAVTTVVFRFTCGKTLLRSVILSSQTLAPSSVFNSSQSAASWHHFQMSWFNIQISRAALVYLGHEIKIYAVKRESSDTFRKSFFLSWNQTGHNHWAWVMNSHLSDVLWENWDCCFCILGKIIWGSSRSVLMPRCEKWRLGVFAVQQLASECRTLTTRWPRLRRSPGQM